MDAMQNLLTRRSVRKYKSDMIPRDVLEKIIEAGVWAPTGGNKQTPIIIAVTNPELRQRLSDLNNAVVGREGDAFFGAPVVLVVLGDKNLSGNYVYDGSLVMGNLMLAAHAMGVSSCWIHRAKQVFDSPEGKAILAELGIEGDFEGIGHCILGYADGPIPEPKPRKENYVYWAE